MHRCASRARPGSSGPCRPFACAPRSRCRRTFALSSDERSLAQLSDEELQKELDFVLGPPLEDDWTYGGTPVEDLAAAFDMHPFILIGEGPHGHPIIFLEHPNGTEAAVHLHGGVVTSWTDKDGLEMLFLHPDNDFNPSFGIRGGMRPVFPQYAGGLPGMSDRATLPTDGFLDKVHFTVVATHYDDEWGHDACPGVTLRAESDDDTLREFPHEWEMIYQVNLMDGDDPRPENLPGQYMVEEDVPVKEEASKASRKAEEYLRSVRGGDEGEDDDEEPLVDLANFSPVQLRVCISIENRGESTFQFQAAALGDLAVRDLKLEHQYVKAVGLKSRTALDVSQVAAPQVVEDARDFLHPEVEPGVRQNLVYGASFDTDVLFCPGNRQHYKVMWEEGLGDFILAHPDVREQDFSHGYVTLGTGKVAQPVVLKPGEVWHGSFSLRKHYKYWPDIPFEDKDTIPLPESAPQ